MKISILLEDAEEGAEAAVEMVEEAMVMLEKASGSKEVAAELGKAAPSRRLKHTSVLPSRFHD